MKTSSLFILIVTITNFTCAVIHAQEFKDTPIFIQNLERSIVGNYSSKAAIQKNIGSGFKVELYAGTRTYETAGQLIAREQYNATPVSSSSMAAPKSHLTTGIEIKKSFPINDKLRLVLLAGMEARIALSPFNSGNLSKFGLIPYAGATITYDTDTTGSYDASLLINGNSLLSTGSTTVSNPENTIITPSAAPVSLRLGWNMGGKKKG